MAWVGTSGWSYDHWDGVLYPPGTPPAGRLDLYTREFGTVELNASHYRWPRNATFASWRRRLPDGFRMSVKAPRGLTHAKKLYSPEVWVDRIAASWHELRERRAVLLVQLPPTLERDDARLDWFLGRLPWWVPVAVELRHPSGLPAVAGSLWAVLFACGLALPNAPALALSRHGEAAGTAAALLGAIQFGVGALVSPVVGLLGNDAVAIGSVVVTALLLAIAVLVVVVRPWQLPTPDDAVDVAAH